MGSSLFNFSRRATRDADRLEIRKCDGRTDLRTDGHLTWVGARDACASKNKELETRLEDKMRKEVEESIRRELAASYSNHTLTNPSLRDLPVVLISAWQDGTLSSPQTVTFDSFLANYNNAARPGGGDGVLDLDSGVFTCFTPGYYTVSFSAHGAVGSDTDTTRPELFLYKNGMAISESVWSVLTDYPDDTLVGATGSRTVVRNIFKKFA